MPDLGETPHAFSRDFYREDPDDDGPQTIPARAPERVALDPDSGCHAPEAIQGRLAAERAEKGVHFLTESVVTRPKPAAPVLAIGRQLNLLQGPVVQPIRHVRIETPAVIRFFK
jgi:hypothetical protein